MAEDTGKVTEIIDIGLEVSGIESSLRRALGEYTKYVSGVGRVSKSLETNVNAMHKQVTSSLSAMVLSTQNEMGKSINFARQNMHGVQTDLSKVNKEFDIYIAKIKKMQDTLASKKMSLVSDFQGSRSALADKYTAEQESIAGSKKGPKTKEKYLDKSLKEYIKEDEAAIKSFNEKAKAELKEFQGLIAAESKRAGEQINYRIGESVAKASTSLASSANKGLQSVKESAKGMVAELKTAFQQIQNQEDFAIGKGKIVGAESSLQGLKDSLKNQAKLISDAAKNTASAKNAMLAQTDDNLKESNQAYYEKAVSNEQKIQEAYKKTEVEISKLEKAIVKMKKASNYDALNEQNSVMKKLGAVGTGAKGESIVDNLEEQISSAQNKIRKAMLTMPKLTGGSMSLFDLKIANDEVRGIEKLDAQLVNSRKAIKSQILKIEDEIKSTRIKYASETNEALRAKLKEYESNLISQKSRLGTVLADAVSPDVGSMRKSLRGTAKAIQLEIQESLSKIGDSRTITENLKKQFEDLNNAFIKNRGKTFLGKGTSEQFKVEAERLKEEVIKYGKTIDLLKAQVIKLEAMNKSGFAPKGTGVRIDALKSQINDMNKYINQLSIASANADKKANILVEKAAKGTFSQGMEMIRNFRWQVAAVYYLVAQTARLIKNTVLNFMDEIQKFQMDTMSVAAGISYSLLGDTKTNFDRALNYSKSLMEQLQLQAAKTILTLEDMSMLTKTFTQAGIIPKSALDVEKIATVGTAIKTLTEGMANAGVQMRQELYAIIQGRQRATDQVAMMFKMQGININKILQDAKKEGKNLIDVLSESLAPFAEVNKRMEESWGAQKNNLDLIWQKIKRLGGENTFDEISRSLKKFNDELANNKTFELTEEGKALAKSFGYIAETSRLALYNITSISKALGDTQKQSESLRVVLMAISGAIAGIASLFDGIVMILGNVITGITGIFAALSVIPTQGIRGAKDILVQTFKDIKDNGVASLDRIEERFLKIVTAMDAVDKSVNKTQSSLESLGTIEVPFPYLADEIAKQAGKIDSEIAKSFDIHTEEGINKRFEIEVSKFKEMAEQAKINISSVLKQFGEKGIDLLNLPASKTTQLNAWQEYINTLDKRTKALENKRLRDIGDLHKKEKDKLAKDNKELQLFLRGLKLEPPSMYSEWSQHWEEERIKLRENMQNNPVFKDYKGPDLFQQLDDAANKDWDIRLKEKLENLQDGIERFGKTGRFDRQKQKIVNEFGTFLDAISRDRSQINDEMMSAALELFGIKISQVDAEEQLFKYAIKYKGVEDEIANIERLRASYSINREEAAKNNLEYQEQLLEILREEAIIPNLSDEKKEDLKVRTDEQLRVITSARLEYNKFHKGLMDGLMEGMRKYSDETKNLFEIYSQGFYDLFQGLDTTLGSFFEDAFKGKLEGGKKYFQAFADEISRITAQIAKDMASNAIKGLIGNVLNSMGPKGNTYEGDFAGSSNYTGKTYPSGVSYIDNPYASGGLITEPVIGVGLRSKEKYSFAENGIEGVFNQSQMASLGKGDVKVNVNVINQSGQPVSAEQGKIDFDGESYIVNVILKNMRNGGALHGVVGR